MAMYEERCLHSDVCKYGKNRTNGMYCTGERCLHFINRTKWVYKPKTNADRIRAMTDEELSEDYCEFLESMLKKLGVEFDFDMDKAKSIMLKYLQQPAEGD